MRIVIQRVKQASVTVWDENMPQDSEKAGRIVGQIAAGLCVLVGVTHEDGVEQIEKIARKICELKLLRDVNHEDIPANRRSVVDAAAEVLLVSQFTLYADVKKGKKPSWSHAAPGELARPIFDQLAAAIRARGVKVETGEFGAMMDVQLINDGPFTILFEC
ncbi:D-aminoacyl-tRNA deacylase [Arcanobacterium hippocoleae]|uniref:D-aminoacyl-tRNA deacylase n=1 Tax=Arcanobacterium hippocoleae TaxID=149017 RepID=A0ABU1T4T3_9ACTO|nr:D-aminoacyl-tRNA deacylase [Arcanobacterium hippocoleae]MDR6939855.1 D-tyrosyl-tRNA(Tyr) deacylase [Arcanobacterium hippocoleae]